MGKAALLFTDLGPMSLKSTQAPYGPVQGLEFDQLSDPQPRHRVRFANTTGVLIMDLGALFEIDFAALISTTITTTSQITLRISTTDPTGLTSLTYSKTITGETAAENNGNVVRIMPVPVQGRYIRWTLGNGPFDVGLAPVGRLTRLTNNFRFGAQRGRMDYGIRDVNALTGTQFPKKGPNARTFIAIFPGITTAEMDTVDAADQALGAAGDCAFIPDVDATEIELAKRVIWGGFRPIGQQVATHTDNRMGVGAHSRSFTFTERL